MSETPQDIAPLRLGLEDADLLIASDLVAATQLEALKTVSARTAIIADGYVPATQKFHENANIDLGAESLVRRLEARAGHPLTHVSAHELAQRAFGDPIAANMILIGAAFQTGVLPVSAEAIERAIRLNGSAVESTLQAFRLGRLSVSNEDVAKEMLRSPEHVTTSAPEPAGSLQARIDLRTKTLRAYQDPAYAASFEDLVGRVRTAEEKISTGSIKLTEAVARNLFKLMAYKDEYEVARLLTDASFWNGVQSTFEGGVLKLHLAPPLLFGRDPATGRPRKRTFSARSLLPILRLLARGKVLRGTVLDPFGWTRERQMERRLRDQYVRLIDEVLSCLCKANHEAAVALVSYPDDIRGFGPVKEEAVARVQPRVDMLRAQFNAVAGGGLASAACEASRLSS